MMSSPPKERDANFLRNHHRTSQVVPEVMLYLPARNVSVCLYQVELFFHRNSPP